MKMEIEWTNYFRDRCKQRCFDLERAEYMIRYSHERYFDVDSYRKIVVGSMHDRLVLIPYEEKDGIVTPVTIHATDRKQINFRTRSGRFVRL